MNKLFPILLVVVLSGCAASKKITFVDDMGTTPKEKILIDGYIYLPPEGGILGIGYNGLKSTDNEAYLKGYRDEDKCFGMFKGTQIDALLGELDSFFDIDFYVCEYEDLKALYIGGLSFDSLREFPIQNKYIIVNEWMTLYIW